MSLDCRLCQPQPGSALLYSFTDLTLYGRCMVSVPISKNPPLLSYEVWWKYVAHLYVHDALPQLANKGFHQLGKIYPRRSQRPAQTCEEFVTLLKERQQSSVVFPPGVHVHCHSLSADEIAASENSSNRNLKTKAIQQFAGKCSHQMDVAIADGAGVQCFTSNAKLDAYRCAVTREPTQITQNKEEQVEVVHGGRMQSRPVMYGIAMPRPAPTSTPCSLEVPNFTLLSEGAPGTGQFIPSEGDATSVFGLIHDVSTKFDEMIQLSICKSKVTERVLNPSLFIPVVITLLLLFFSDGMTPTTENISVHLLQIVDPFKLIFIDGYSPTIRLGSHVGREGLVSSMSPYLVRAISLFVAIPHIVNSTLSLRFKLSFLGGDNKNLGLCLGRGANACPSCQLTRAQFPNALA
jgi:hypothetical protein